MNNPNAGKDIRSLSGCQENIAKNAQTARQSAKTVDLIGQTAKDSAKCAIFFGQSANAPVLFLILKGRCRLPPA
jgi:hypothetical protein